MAIKGRLSLYRAFSGEAVRPRNALRFSLVAVAATASLARPAHGQAQPGEQFIPANSYWAGPYAAAGSAMAAGMLDYLRMLNERDGGIHGVKFTWAKCDTAYDIARGMECYERSKAHPPTGATLVHALSTPIAYSLIERTSADRIPLISIGYGRSDSADGRVFPYVFPLITTHWDEAAAMVRYLGERAGGMDRLRGKHLALLYQDSAYGKEAIPILTELAGRYGYSLSMIAVGTPGDEQSAQWQRIREIGPDWIILWGWGTMNPAALTNAAHAGFPRSRILGAWWSGAEEDVRPAGSAAQGFVTAAFSVPGGAFPVLGDIRRFVYAEGSGELENPARIGSAYYNRGVVFGIVSAEAVRLAQEQFGVGKPVTGEQARWGLEHLRLDAARLAALGASGLMPPLQTSCADHEGAGLVRFLRWDGKRWESISDWIGPLADDRATVQKMTAESAAAYAKGKGITPRRCPES
jgi:branched-chain amino acid transport system substrate-binding protein